MASKNKKGLGRGINALFADFDEEKEADDGVSKGGLSSSWQVRIKRDLAAESMLYLLILTKKKKQMKRLKNFNLTRFANPYQPRKNFDEENLKD